MDPVLRINTARVFNPLLAPSRYKGAYGGRGSGKCLAVGTLVMMADGAIKPVEAISAGEAVMGPDGCSRAVLGTTRGHGPLYRVSQAAAGSYVVTDAHLLSLRRGAHGVGRYPGADVINITPSEYLSWSERRKASFFGYKAGPLAMPAEKLPIPSYVLGAWLGDGCSDRQSITSMDEPVIIAFVAWGDMLGCHEVRSQKTGQRAWTIILTNVQGQPNPAKEVLRALNVLNNKHVPEIYHRSTVADRLEFLAGMIDTDGHYANGCFTVSQKNVGIAKSVKRIADSCGFKTSLRTKMVLVKDERRPYIEVSIGGDVDCIPVRLSRKKATVRKNKDWRIGRLTVESIGEGDYAGFELSGDHLFCLADGTVTHNSHFFAELGIERCVQIPGTRWVCVREVQKSLRESVKLLIEDKINTLDLGQMFHVKHDAIDCPGGGLILFQGMQEHTKESIKSLEGFDIAYVEEAQTMTAGSWEMLRPTIRKVNSEIWVSWNPRHASDPVDAFFRGLSPPADAIIVHTGYADNPFFPEVLEEERAYDEQHTRERYGHVWLGDYEPAAIGAIWDRLTLHQGRVDSAPVMQRIVVAVDPAVSSEEGANEHGIIVAGLGSDGRGYVLDDVTTRGGPQQWAERVVASYDRYEADAVVIEINQGGDMVRHTLRTVRPGLRVIEVRATRGKHVRAEPIAALYTMGRVSHVGAFPQLEDQMCLITAGGYEGEGSCDRVDALVWAMAELFPRLTKKATPRGLRPTRANSVYSPHRWREHV